MTTGPSAASRYITGIRITGVAQPGEVLVSNTVKDLVAGSGITFTDRGTHILKGLPGEWRLFTPDVPEASAPENQGRTPFSCWEFETVCATAR